MHQNSHHDIITCEGGQKCALIRSLPYLHMAIVINKRAVCWRQPADRLLVTLENSRADGKVCVRSEIEANGRV